MQELGELIHMPKYGKLLHKFVHQFPRLQLSASIQPVTRGLLKIDLVISADFKWEVRHVCVSVCVSLCVGEKDAYLGYVHVEKPPHVFVAHCDSVSWIPGAVLCTVHCWL